METMGVPGGITIVVLPLGNVIVIVLPEELEPTVRTVEFAIMFGRWTLRTVLLAIM